MTRLRGILFDMDDTLIDWSDFHGDWRVMERRHLGAVYQFLSDAGRSLETDFETFNERYGNRVRDAWMEARNSLRAPHLGFLLMETLREYGFVPDARISERACLEAYQWGPVDGVTVFPDTPALLEDLQARGIKVGIVTNAFQPMWLREAELVAYDLLRYFPERQALLSAADVGYLKPHRAIFRRALECLGTTAEETLFIGDNPVADIAGSQAAGMRAILRVKTPPAMLLSGLIVPDSAINTFEELPALLADWFPGW